jgi:hypothetical protein
MQRPRMQQTMPEDRNGWHHIDAGPHLEVLFHPDRRLTGRGRTRSNGPRSWLQ